MTEKQTQTKVGIINYDCGNIQSIVNSIKYLGYQPNLVSRGEDLLLYKKIILPGVGSFEHAVTSLKKKGLFESIKKWVLDDSHTLLGICLGMQILCMTSEESSEEGITGLSLIKGKAISLKKISGDESKVPHMGWNNVNIADNKVFTKNKLDFYFVHSYGIIVDDESNCLAKTKFGNGEFCSMITNGNNIFGVQFHPEKSHNNGLALLKEFLTHA